MSQKQTVNNFGATRGKLVLIGVLALVLVLVVWIQLPKRATEDMSVASDPVSQQQAKVGSVGMKSLPSIPRENSELPSWPEIHLSETLATDPFQPPSWFVQVKRVAKETNDDPEQLAELQKLGASIVVISDGQKSATIGGQKYNVGDVLEGYEIADITTQGVILNRLISRSSQ